MGHPAGQVQVGGGTRFPLPFTMAFQPIVDVETCQVFAHEALVRGADGAGAGAVLAHLTPGNRWAFDHDTRLKAVTLACGLGLAAPGERPLLSINFLPNAVADPAESLEATVEAATLAGLPLNRIILEFTEHEPIEPGHLQAILNAYRAIGVRTAIDDFGAGYSGLSLLSRFQPDVVKLDMALIRCIDLDRVKRTIVAHLVRLAGDLGVLVVAEGIETLGEYEALADLGVVLQQGYLFAKPAFEAFADPCWPGADTAARAAA